MTGHADWMNVDPISRSSITATHASLFLPTPFISVLCAVMSAPSQPAGPAAAAAAAPATPVRVSEGTPNPERTFTLAQLKEYDGRGSHHESAVHGRAGIRVNGA